MKKQEYKLLPVIYKLYNEFIFNNIKKYLKD